MAGLVQGTDGDFYGTTSGGGAALWGTVFKMTPKGRLTTLHKFNGTQGSDPQAALIQATDGNFYGTTVGQKSDLGTVFRVSTGLVSFVQASPASGRAGARVTILGNNLESTTAVTFNGTPVASFTVNSTASAISTTVPSAATTGTIQVTLANGSTLSSNVPFRITQ
jgi:uncharacterized repeat protein (TIGR03803 family)